MKKLVTFFIFIICNSLATIQAETICLDIVTEYINTFYLIREPNNTVKQELSEIINKNLSNDFTIEDWYAKELIFHTVNASEQEIEFFESILNNKNKQTTSIQKTLSVSQKNKISFIDKVEKVINKAIFKFKALFSQKANTTNIQKQTNIGHFSNTIRQNKDYKNFVQLHAHQQDGQACGHNTLANALAIQELQNNKQMITSSSIKITSEKYRIYLLQSQGLQNEEKVGLDYQLYNTVIKNKAIELGLQNFCVINIDPYYHELFITYNSSNNFDTTITQDYLQDFFLNMINKNIAQNNTTYFLCTSGYHWTLFVVQKNTNNTAYTIHLNSTNAPLSGTQSEFARIITNSVAEYNGGLI